MSIGSINSGSVAATAWTSQTTARRKDAVDTVASLLSMSRDELTTQLRSGRSMDDVAEAAGVSHDDLVKALKDGMPDKLAESGDADQIAETIATQKGMPTRGPDGPGGPGGPQGPPPPRPPDDSSTSGVFGTTGLTTSQSDTLDKLASLLGTDSSSLLDALKGGTSLVDLVKQKNISSSALAGVMQDGLLIDAKA